VTLPTPALAAIKLTAAFRPRMCPGRTFAEIEIKVRPELDSASGIGRLDDDNQSSLALFFFLGSDRDTDPAVQARTSSRQGHRAIPIIRHSPSCERRCSLDPSFACFAHPSVMGKRQDFVYVQPPQGFVCDTLINCFICMPVSFKVCVRFERVRECHCEASMSERRSRRGMGISRQIASAIPEFLDPVHTECAASRSVHDASAKLPWPQIISEGYISWTATAPARIT
jgi:hypothetical protein